MTNWTKEKPGQPGHYWVLFQGSNIPSMIYVNQYWQALQFGTRELCSTHYDIALWWPEPVEPPK